MGANGQTAQAPAAAHERAHGRPRERGSHLLRRPPRRAAVPRLRPAAAERGAALAVDPRGAARARGGGAGAGDEVAPLIQGRDAGPGAVHGHLQEG